MFLSAVSKKLDDFREVGEIISDFLKDKGLYQISYLPLCVLLFYEK